MGVIDFNFLKLKTKLRISDIEAAVRRKTLRYCKNFIIKIIKTCELFHCYAKTIYHTIFELNKIEFEID
jgi:hypothetical protein